MDGIDKRILRRHSELIARQLRVNVVSATAAFRQGLLTQEQLENILEPPLNRDRVARFLSAFEDISLAPISKLTYFLRSQGHSVLADAIEIDYHLETGHIVVDLKLLDKVTAVIKRNNCDDLTNVEKLSLITSAAIQLQEFYHKAEEGKDFVALVSMLSASLAPFACGELQRNVSQQKRRDALDPCRKRPATICGTLKEEWESMVVQKDGFLQNTDHTPSKDESENNRSRRDSFSRNGQNIGLLSSSLSRMTLNDDASMRKRNAWPPLQIQRVQASNFRPTSVPIDPNGVIRPASCGGFPSAPSSFIREFQIKRQTNTGLPRINSKHTDCKDFASTAISAETGNRNHLENDLRFKLRSKKRKLKKKTEPKVDFSNTSDVRDKLKDLQQTKYHVQNVKRAVSVQNNRRINDAAANLEGLYWKKRCEFMKQCQATGYYYFLSEHKRIRCEACSGDDVTKQEPDRGFQAERADQTSARPELNLYRSSSFVQMGKSSQSLRRQEKSCSSGSKNDTYDDSLCPGAGNVPGQMEARCLPCAYANGEETTFFNSVIDFKGDTKYDVPSLKVPGVPKGFCQHARDLNLMGAA